MNLLKGIGLLVFGGIAMLILEFLLVVYCLLGVVFDRRKLWWH